MSIPLEHDYIGLSEISSMEKRHSEKLSTSSSDVLNEEKQKNNNNNNNGLLNLKETELRLGLPGSESPSQCKTGPGVSLFGKDLEDNNSGYSSVKNFVSAGAKRGFSQSGFGKASVLFNNTHQNNINGIIVEDKKASPSNLPPASKAQVVGWPPIRSFRKNTMATTNNNVAKNLNGGNSSDVGVETTNSCVYVKVSMDGAPYLRKVDLKTYSNYLQLSSALENMFTCFTIGQCSSHGVPGREGLSASRLMDIVNCSEYVLTYQDKDGDWMLVGDVPWDMFTDSCKRLRIMKGSEAIGLAPRAMEKCKSRN